MKFSEVIEQASALLERTGRLSYRALKREFDLDDVALDDLKNELIEIQELATDKDGKMLVWTGEEIRSPDDALITISSGNLHPPEAERRQLTVMFCDIVGATDLSERLDPEEFREIVRAYQAVSAEVVERFDGHIAQYLGDGLLVYFGYPKAHEDDAERAVRAGLGIVAALQDLNTRLPHPIQVRVGLHTGRVVVGEMGSGHRHEQLALGETPNIAARIQGLAEANAVVVSDATYQLVQGLFTSTALERQTVKGIAAPLSIFQVVGESGAQSRFEAAIKTGLTPLVGRKEEVGLLERHWAQVKDGGGQVVLLSGEPGIGKSRLVQALKDQILDDGTPRIEFRCSPYYQNTALHPVIDHLEELLRFAPHEAVASRMEKLEQLLADYHFPQDDTLPLLASLLSLPMPEGCLPLNLNPERQKQRTLETLVGWLMEEAERQAVYCAWEDLHWADPSTMELLELFLDHVPTARLFTVLTFRPEFRPPWELRSHISHITLSRMGRAQVEQLVAEVIDGKALPNDVIQQIVTKTDGVPLFVEELTKMVVESELVQMVNDHYELSRPLPPLAIPSTLQDSLMARLDRLTAGRELAQLGATLGREFSYNLIHAVSSLDESTLVQGLEQLVGAELIYRKGLPPQATYLFKHALVQDTAYQSLLKSRRQQFHQHIAQVLEQQFPEVVNTQPELLAHHYTEAGAIEHAVPYWYRAGQNAIEQSANAEALNHLTQGLVLIGRLASTQENIRSEIAVRIALGVAEMATKGFASPEVAETYTRARELCHEIGDKRSLFTVTWGLWISNQTRVQYHAAQMFADELLSLAHELDDPELVLEAHHAGWTIGLFRGEVAAALLHCEQGARIYEATEHHHHVSLYGGHDPGVCGLCIQAVCQWTLGHPDAARASVTAAVALAEKLSHPFSLTEAMSFGAVTYQLLRGPCEAARLAARTRTLSDEHGFGKSMWTGLANIAAGWTTAQFGEPERATQEISAALETWRGTGSEMFAPYFLGLLGEACTLANRATEALGYLGEALSLAEANDEHWWDAELHRLKGVALLNADDNNGAEAQVQFERALDVARHQHAKSWELRAATSLARLWQQQGKQAETRQLLSESYNWFTEGFDTQDLEDARALLEELVDL